MDTMNDLLICAEVLGYSAEVVGDEVWLYHCNVDTSSNPAPGSNIKILSTVWEPDKCDAQAMELLKWLCKQTEDDFLPIENIDGRWWIEFEAKEKGTTEGRGDTLNEAIIKAVVAMEGEG